MRKNVANYNIYFTLQSYIYQKQICLSNCTYVIYLIGTYQMRAHICTIYIVTGTNHVTQVLHTNNDKADDTSDDRKSRLHRLSLASSNQQNLLSLTFVFRDIYCTLNIVIQ